MFCLSRILQALEEYLLSIYSYKKVTEVLNDCYWFESYTWWRSGPRPPCLNSVVWMYKIYPMEDKLHTLQRTLDVINEKYCRENPILRYGTICFTKPHHESLPSKATPHLKPCKWMEIDQQRTIEFCCVSSIGSNFPKYIFYDLIFLVCLSQEENLFTLCLI